MKILELPGENNLIQLGSDAWLGRRYDGGGGRGGWLGWWVG